MRWAMRVLATSAAASFFLLMGLSLLAADGRQFYALGANVP